jgi:hypothetical protein
MVTKQRKGFKRGILAAALAAFLAVGAKAGAEEIKIGTKTEPFTLEATLAMDSLGAVNDLGQAIPNVDLGVYGEYNFDSGYKLIGDFEMENTSPRKAVLAFGHPHVYLGAKWENLSGETSMLEDANLFKLEMGLRDIAEFLDISSFLAYTSIPNMKTRWKKYTYDDQPIEDYYNTPLQLFSAGIEGITKPKFELKNSILSPWISGKILSNGAWAQNTENIDPDYDVSSFAWAFNHFNIGLGADFSTKYFDIGLENYWEGNYDPFMSGTKHKAKIGFHNKEDFLKYSFTANPQFNWLGWPANWDLQSDIDFRFHFTPEVYVKGNLNMNHSTIEDPNFTAALGYLNKDGTNIELFFNLQSQMVGIALSSRNLGNKLERYSKEPFVEIAPSNANFYSINHDSTKIHEDWGEDVSNVISKIRPYSSDYNSAMKEISRYASYFSYDSDDHPGTYTAEQEHDIGSGVCRDTNGVLLPTVINGVLESKGYKSWGRVLFGPYVGHAVTIIKKPNKRYDVMNYDDVYFLDAKTEQEAIDSIYPGAYAYDGGKYSETAQRVINALEESIWR